MTLCLVCDDHALVRAALCQMLRQILPGATLHEAADFAAACDRMVALRPDLCLTDLRMPGASPEAGVMALQQASPGTPILVVTGSEDDLLLHRLMALGIAGFLDKTSDLSLIAAAMQTLLAGGRHVPPRLLSIAGTAPPPPLPLPPASFSPRQAEVLDLVAQGHSNKDIARQLALAPSTVKTHLETAMRQLGATNRTQAAHLWRLVRPARAPQ